MAKNVEITFAIGAALAGSFAGTFGKAGKALSDFQKQAESLQKVSGQLGQIEAFQKTQGAIVKNAAEMYSMREQAESLNTQAAASKSHTAELTTQYRAAEQEVERLHAENVRNTDSYKAAQLNAKSLANQITTSNQPTAELQKQYKAAQEEVRRLEGAMKQSSSALKAAQANAKQLKTQMKQASSETKSLSDKSKELTRNADKLQSSIKHDTEALDKMRSEMAAAGIDTKNLASEQARLTQQSQKAAEAQNKLQRAQAKYEAAKQQLSFSNIKGDIMASAGLAYALYKPVSQAADLESAMARLNAVAFSGGGRNKEEDAKSLEALEKQARQLGRDTQFTAVQAANAQENLARAGFKANEIIAAMPGLLSMAAAEGLDLATASDIAASTLRGFKLSADQSGRVADVLAQASAASNTNIRELGEAMKYVAPVASNLGVSVEEVSAALGIMANNGIKGSEGGTALRNAFLRLSQEPKAVADALAALGIASRDARGDMRKLPSIMTELSKKMAKMGEADKTKYLANIFGVRAVSGMMAYMNGVMSGEFDKLYQLEKEATGVLQAVTDAVNAEALKAGNKEAVVSLDEMRAGMKNAEPLAQKLGISFRDMSIYLAMFAEKGIKGTQADNVLTAMFTRLKKEHKQVKKALKSLNIDPNIKELPDLLNAIDTALSGMDDEKKTKALESIFGKGAKKYLKDIQKLVTGASNSFVKYNKAAEGAKGVSYEMMQKQLATFRGQWDITKSAIQDFMIETGNILLPYVTSIVKGLGKITNGITYVMREYPKMSQVIVTSLGIIATLKIVDKVQKIGTAVVNLSTAWMGVAAATGEAQAAAGLAGAAAGKAGGMFSALWGIVAAHPFLALLTVTVLIYTYWEDICALVEKAMKLSDEAQPKMIKNSAQSHRLQSLETVQGESRAAQMAGGRNKAGHQPVSRRKRALGGIITRPEIALIGEAGREAVIPLENQTRGMALWVEAGRELGVISNEITTINNLQTAKEYDVLPQIVNAMRFQPQINNVIPHAEGGIFSQPHIGLVAEAGREAIIPLEDRSRGIPLWKAAGKEMGMSFGNSSVNNNITPVFSPNINITVNGGDADSEQKLRGIFAEIFEDLFMDFQARMQRVAFE